MTRLVQIADDHSTDTDIVRLVGTGEDALIPLVYLFDIGGYQRTVLFTGIVSQ